MKLSEEVRERPAYAGRVRIKTWADRIAEMEQECDRLREALSRQTDNISFLINRCAIQDSMYEKIVRELEEDREALRQSGWHGNTDE